MFPNWWHAYGEGESLANEAFFEFGFDGVTIVGVIDRIGELESGGTRITDFKTGNPDAGPKAEESLQLGIYYLAVQESRGARAVPAGPRGRARVPEGPLAHRRDRGEAVDGHARQGGGVPGRRPRRAVAADRRAARLLAEEVYRPNPQANCYWCDFRSLCPLWPEGRPVFEVAT